MATSDTPDLTNTPPKPQNPIPTVTGNPVVDYQLQQANIARNRMAATQSQLDKAKDILKNDKPIGSKWCNDAGDIVTLIATNETDAIVHKFDEKKDLNILLNKGDVLYQTSEGVYGKMTADVFKANYSAYTPEATVDPTEGK